MSETPDRDAVPGIRPAESWDRHEPHAPSEDRAPAESGDRRETFTETLTTVAETGRDHMHPFPVAAVIALNRRRRRQRSLAALSLAITTCAVAVGVALGAGPGHDAAPLPPTGSTPTIGQKSPTGSLTVPAEFLQPSELPGAAEFAWKVKEVTDESFTWPLPTTCGQIIGSEYIDTVRDATYTSGTGSESVHETVFTYDSADHAADRMVKLTPACGAPNAFIHTEDGFAWAENLGPMVDHMVVARHGAQIATVDYIQYSQALNGRDYDSARDSDVLASMLRHLAAGSFLNPDQIPFPADGPWHSHGDDVNADSVQVTDVCTAATDPVNTKAGADRLIPQGSAERTWGPGSPGTSASETIHVYASPDDARTAYQKAKSLYAVQTCQVKRDATTATRTISRGEDVGHGDSTGFAIGATDSIPADATGCFRTYVVLKNSSIAVLMVPVTKEHVDDRANDHLTVAAMADRLP